MRVLAYLKLRASAWTHRMKRGGSQNTQRLNGNKYEDSLSRCCRRRQQRVPFIPSISVRERYHAAHSTFRADIQEPTCSPIRKIDPAPKHKQTRQPLNKCTRAPQNGSVIGNLLNACQDLSSLVESRRGLMTPGDPVLLLTHFSHLFYLVSFFSYSEDDEADYNTWCLPSSICLISLGSQSCFDSTEDTLTSDESVRFRLPSVE